MKCRKGGKKDRSNKKGIKNTSLGSPEEISSSKVSFSYDRDNLEREIIYIKI